MDYRKSAQEVLDNIGGAGNVVSAAHCATRLRLVIADNAKVDKDALENIDGAKGVEAQTRKLMEVCRMRQTPVIVFINKLCLLYTSPSPRDCS